MAMSDLNMHMNVQVNAINRGNKFVAIKLFKVSFTGRPTKRVFPPAIR